MKKHFLTTTISSLFLITIMTIANIALADEVSNIVKNSNCPSCAEVTCSSTQQTDDCGKYCCGDYQLNDFMALAIKFSKFLLGITGSLALLAFVVGGMIFLISAGSSEKVETAKKIITGAVIGIFIVFTSYIIIGFVFKSLGVESNWFESTWMK